MKKLTTYYNNIINIDENLFLYFKLGNNKYGIDIKNVVEAIKLPLLDYPQRLPNNFIGLLKYNNFTLNVIDLRFYLKMKIQPYSVSNQLLIVKTDEALMALIVDKVENILAFDMNKIEPLEIADNNKIIEFMYQNNGENISILNLSSLENLFKQGVETSEIDIPSLFPNDDDSQYELTQRKLLLREKNNQFIDTNLFSQDKFITFSLNESLYCLDLVYIKEFIKNCTITKIPCDFDYIAGVIFLRGDFVTIINTKIFLGFDEIQENYDNKQNIIIVEISDFKIGFIVDEIFNIINIPEETILDNSKMQDKYIQSEVIIEDKLYSILNIKNILSDEKLFIEE